MSIKKELLNELSEKQLRQLADEKGVSFKLNQTQKIYYEDWNEKDVLIDMMNDYQQLSIKDIEKFILEEKTS